MTATLDPEPLAADPTPASPVREYLAWVWEAADRVFCWNARWPAAFGGCDGRNVPGRVWSCVELCEDCWKRLVSR